MGLLLIGAATSADIFAAALGISAGGIKFPVRSAFASALSGAAVLWLSALMASAADKILPLEWAVYISKAILLPLKKKFTILKPFKNSSYIMISR